VVIERLLHLLLVKQHTPISIHLIRLELIALRGSAMCQFDSIECCRGVDGAAIASEAIPRLDR
jgi:hypothetical protein